MIRKCVEAKSKGAPNIRLWGDGCPTREFLYVEDAARGILLAAEHYDSSQPVNLGSGHEISIRELAEEIKNITEYDGEIVWDTSQPNGQPRRCLDVTKAHDQFGFSAQVSLSEGLHNTVDWYLKRKAASSTFELSAAD